jgi:hypothetical protein
MKRNKIRIIKTLSCSFILLFVVNVAMAQQFENGTILSSDNATKKAELRMSGKSYDENMLGVYYNNSTTADNPMFKTDPISSGGITYVRYNSESGMVKKGDLITSSSEPGVGMKATGTGLVLGFALEDATASSGLIKIRVLIQYIK